MSDNLNKLLPYCNKNLQKAISNWKIYQELPLIKVYTIDKSGLTHMMECLNYYSDLVYMHHVFKTFNFSHAGKNNLLVLQRQ